MWNREADKVEAGYLQQRMNERSTVTFAVIDGQCQVSLTETSSVSFAVVRISGFQHQTKNITRTLSYLPANSMKNDCSISAVSLGLSSDASPA